MLDHLAIWVNGRRHVVRGADAFLSLSDFLRRKLGLMGTKIVCSEGDCGACTVLIGRATDGEERLTYLPVDSCIQYLFQLDGTHIVTVEGLGGVERSCSNWPSERFPPSPHDSGATFPTAVQQSMIDCHGSQCGFCTPGFVVTMTGLLEEYAELDEAVLRRGLTGNLCRCTGYTPIIEAGERVETARHRRLEELYPSRAMLADFAQRRRQPIEVSAQWNGERHVIVSPPDLATALTFFSAHPDATVVAGATDVGVRINKSLAMPPTILDLNRVAELDGILLEDGEMVCGARTSWTALEKVCQTHVPEFHKIIERFGAPQIRHVGTLGGNIANASPIADSLPFLYVMEARLELRSASGSRTVNINDFYRGYKQFDLRPGELIGRVRIALPAEGELLRLYKVSRRRDLDIASFTAAIRMRLEEGIIAAAAIAFGAVGPNVIRARKTEQFLRGQALEEETMRRAGSIAVSEISPISDVRGTADYRCQLARNILLKFYHEAQGVAVPV